MSYQSSRSRGSWSWSWCVGRTAITSYGAINVDIFLPGTATATATATAVLVVVLCHQLKASGAMSKNSVEE